MSETVVWMRRRRGGNRAVAPLVVRVVGETPAGNLVVERTRRHRILRDVVQPKNIGPLVEIRAEVRP